MANHIIHKQNVTLKIQEVTAAWKLQDRLSQLYKTTLSRELESVLDRISDDDDYIRIDKLQLDLGRITPANFESQFRERLSAELSKVLLDIKHSPNENVKVTNKNQTSLDLLLYFLEHGYLPWYATVKNSNDLEEHLKSNLTVLNWNYFLQWLHKQNESSGSVSERFISQFSDDFLAFVITQSQASTGNFTLTDYTNLVSLTQLLTGETKESIRYKTWRTIFIKSPEVKDIIFEALKLNLSIDHFLPVFNSMLPELEDSFIKLLTAANKSIDTVFNSVISFIIFFKSAHLAGLKAGSLKTLLESVKPKKEFSHAIDSEHVKSAFLKIMHEFILISSENMEKDKKKGSSKDKPKYKNREMQAEETKDLLLERDGLLVQNCGIVLLHPFLPQYFTGIGLCSDGAFISEESLKKSPLLLNFLATGNGEVPEFNLPLQKILCGMNLNGPVPLAIELTEKEITESENLLKAVINYWPPLNRTSIEGLRATFLQREGKLSKTENGWKLFIENKTVDILLDKLPWGYSTIKLPWMDGILTVNWR